MNTTKTYKGIFWIPSEPDNHKNGILKFHGDTGYIDLFGSFDEDPLRNRSTRRNKIDTIIGILSNSQCCILDKCELSLSNVFGLLGTYINFECMYYSSNQDLIYKPIKFKSIDIKFNTLFHWSGNNVIETESKDHQHYQLSYKKLDRLELLYSDDFFNLKLNHQASLPVSTNRKSLSVEQDTFLTLELLQQNNELDEDKFIDKIHDIFILINADKVEYDNIIELTNDKEEKFFYRLTNRRRFRDSKAFSDNEFSNLFTFEFIKERISIQDFFTNWFSLYSKYEYPIELLTKCLSNISMNFQHRFINLMYSLDVIQQQDKVSKRLTEKIELTIKEKSILKKLKDTYGVDDNTVNSLKRQLEKKKKPNLKDKITLLLEPYKLVIENLIGFSLEEFIEKVVNTRNFLTHETETEPKIELVEFFDYNLRLEIVLLLIFFNKVGLELDDISKQVKRHRRFSKVIK